MELLYVWIEEYNNIKRQGFNFSPKHKFHFEPNEKEGPVTGGTLTHEDINPNYPENFFGENISNITAIVGKNGSGKSSLIKAILKLDVFLSKYIFFISKDTDGYHLTINNNSHFRDETGLQLDLLDESLFITKMLYYSPFINSNTNYIGKPQGDISNTLCLSAAINAQRHNAAAISTNYSDIAMPTLGLFHAQEMNRQIKFVSAIASQAIEEITIPKMVTLLIPCYVGIPNEGILTRELVNSLLLESLKKQFELWVENRSELENKTIQALLSQNSITGPLDTTDTFCERLTDNKYRKKVLDGNSVVLVDIPLGEVSNLGVLPVLIEGTYRSLDWILLAGIEIIWQDLSDGEATMLSLFARLWEELQKNEQNYIILLDEFELGLHPQWQKEAISRLISFFNSLNTQRHHLILSSHSPFLVSDLPRENVIFLNTKEDEKGKPWCKVCEPENMEHTFGSNIHSLYRSSFFMQDGLMGKFAKGKIDGVIGDLRSNGVIADERKKEMEYIIDMVGEPIIRNQLRNMYNEKFHLYGNLNERIAKLESELAELKSMKG